MMMKYGELIECYLNLSLIPHPDCHSLNYFHIWQMQQHDENLLALYNKYSGNYVKLVLDDIVDDIICKKKTEDNWKIV